MIFQGESKITTKVRFGVFTGQVVPIQKLIQFWQSCEDIGFDCLFVADHFAHWNKKLDPFWECWTMLSAIASNTSKIRFSAFVSNMSWRHPAWLAKQILALDHLSNGRITIGLGAGRHNTTDQKWIQAEDWSNKERVERFREYVEVIDLLLRYPTITYKGKYYQLQDAPLNPECVQKPRPPIFIGTKGKKMLKTVAYFADTWNCLANIDDNLKDITFEEIKEKNALLDTYCEKIGRNPKEICRSMGFFEINALQNLTHTKLYNKFDVLEGIIMKYLEIGFTEIILPHPIFKEEIPQFEKFVAEVIPNLRGK
jgi:alkanesulfonate monooxygenase SsuD/methylene tetrahydromethanopterin reductase-like flavin-dependent oxidoreductase (luciferase family)